MPTIPTRHTQGEYSSQIPYFLDNFLSNFETAIPKGAQWILYFEGIENIVDVVLNTIREREPTRWFIDELAKKIGQNTIIQKDKGCLFAQAVEIPSESTIANPEGLQMNGFLRTTAGGGRTDYSAGIRIGFLETNYSFVDTIIRPWVVTTGHLGLIARTKPEEQYRCNLFVIKLGVKEGPIINRDGTLKTPGTAPIPLQKYKFFNVCPVSITGEEYNYSASTGPVIRETTFIYDYYTIDGDSTTTTNDFQGDFSSLNPDIAVPRFL